MKAMILSAGRGERLRPLTDHTPKPLLKAGKYRLIEYLIQSLVKAGFTELVINTAHLSEQFPTILGDGSQFGAQISYSPEQQGGLETAGGIINALALLGDEPFLIVNGDIWTDFPFEQLTNFSLSPDTLAHLVLVNNPEHNLQGDFSLNLGRINQTEQQRYTYSGIAIYHPKLFSGFQVQRLALKPVLLQAIEQQQISGQLYQGQWSDIGTVERLQQLNAQLEN
ncbi:MAG: mannose-1-phosphate guanylyltransferase [Gammaproteobacteria bacterium]|nr:MAG: mannose-1-phosphate guanylyltransferase [Gammaproteobacteria bacterium]